ncbi:MAG: hypothetical protein M0011_06225 [Elusimicrobia bacterium]|nr:hypothetical protein [Elusimicrobiota bacterium]
MGKFITLLLLGLLAVYGLLLAKPDLYFDRKLEHGSFVLHARGPLPDSPEAVLDDAEQAVAASDIYLQGSRFDVYLPSGPGQYKFFTPLLSGDYFRVGPFNGAIYLANADFTAKEARPYSGAEQRRSLRGVLVAAAVWDMVRLKVRPLTFFAMDKWMVRGYAEMISGGTGEFAPQDACGAASRPGLDDYRFGLMLDRVLKEENTVFNDLLGRNYSEEQAESRFRKAYCGAS